MSSIDDDSAVSAESNQPALPSYLLAEITAKIAKYSQEIV